MLWLFRVVFTPSFFLIQLMLPQISPLTLPDVSTVSKLADTIWHQHYRGIISIEQIDYMLKQRYQPNLILEQLATSGIWWRKLTINEEIIGFCCCVTTDNPKELKIDKLYVHCNHHRKRYGAMLIAEAIKIMQDNDLESLILTVNKHNQTAIDAYHRYGFKITRDSVVDIGGGFVMNDYLMTLTPSDLEKNGY